MPHWTLSLDETMVIDTETRRCYVAEDTAATSRCTKKRCHIHRDNGNNNFGCPHRCEASHRKDGRCITWVRRG